MMRALLRLVGLMFAYLARRILASKGQSKPEACLHCAAPICIACGLHREAVVSGGGFCSAECADTPPENRRTTAMRGGVCEEIQYI